MAIKIFDLNALDTFNDWDSWFYGRIKPKILLEDSIFTRPIKLDDERFIPPLGRLIYLTDGKEEMMIEQFRKWKSLTNRQNAYYKQIRVLQEQNNKLTNELREIEKEIIQEYTSNGSQHNTYIRVDGIEYNINQYGIHPIEFIELNNSRDSILVPAELSGIETDISEYKKEIKSDD